MDCPALNELDAVAVDLPGGCERILAIKDVQKSPPVFMYVLGRVFVKTREI